MTPTFRRNAGSFGAWFSGSAPVNATVFFLFVVVGATYIVAAKLRGFDPFAVTFGPVLIMFLYAALIGAARLLRLRDDQSGDNLYYMGFLFTLTSLGVSLYQFDPAAGGETIVKDFGVAVASTIAGIALRIFFNQMRRDPLEVEASVRAELADSARRVRRELDNAVVEFNGFRRVLQQSVAEGFEETRRQVDEVSARVLGGVEHMVRRSAEILDGSLRESTLRALHDIESATRSLSTEVARLSQSAGQVSEGMDAVFAKLGEIRDPENLIKLRLAPALDGLTQIMSGLAARADAHARAMGEAVDRGTVLAERPGLTLDDMRQDIEAVRQSMDRVAAAMRDLAHSRRRPRWFGSGLRRLWLRPRRVSTG
jgi:methyl-accepting chemotaxis protein